MEEGVVDGVKTRLGITGRRFTAADVGPGVNGGGLFRVLLTTTR